MAKKNNLIPFSKHQDILLPQVMIAKIYQIKITLKGLKPPFWRRLLIPAGITFSTLHTIIQIAFGWKNKQDFAFDFKAGIVGAKNGNIPITTIIDELLEKERECIYEYDSVNKWTHKIILEGVPDIKPDERYPICISGRRLCPSETYQTAIDNTHDESKPEQFNLHETNQALQVIVQQIAQPLKTDIEKLQNKQPSREQWEKLYSYGLEIRLLKPWNRLWDSNLFVIELPNHTEPCFVSVMGHAGKCCAIGIYEGYESLASLLRVTNAPPDEPFFVTMGEQNYLMCNYGNRDEITPPDQKIITSLGLKFYGKTQWNYFRSIRPGYAPWYLEADEADLLIQVLKNFIAAVHALDDKWITVKFSEGEIFWRKYDAKKKLWHNEAHLFQSVRRIEHKFIFNDELLAERLKLKKQTNYQLSLDLLYLPIPIQEHKGDRPYYPRLALLVDNNGEVCGNQMIKPNDNVAMELLPNLSDYIMQFGRPLCLHIRNQYLVEYVGDYCEKIGIKLVVEHHLPIIDKMISDLLETFSHQT